MKKQLFWKIIIFGIALAFVGTNNVPSLALADRPGDTWLEWTWEAPRFHLATVQLEDGRLYTRVELPGYANVRLPGRPVLPVVSKLVVLPPRGDFALEIVEAEYETLPLEHPVEPAFAPQPFPLAGEGTPFFPEGRWERDEALYRSTLPYPATFAAMDAPAWMGDMRVARVTVYPLRYIPARQTLDVLRHLRLRIVVMGGNALLPVSRIASPGIAPLLNAEDVVRFRAADGPPLDAPAAIPAAPGDYKILVEEEGLYSISYEVLAAVGLPVGSINPATLHLYHAGSEIAALWDGDTDSTFEPGEQLLFYARPNLTRYARYDVYWLSWGGANGLRMTSRSGNPASVPTGVPRATVLAEENLSYDSLHPGRDGGHWFWRQLKQPDILSDTFTISLETPTDDAGQITVWLQGVTRAWPDPDHHVRFTLNGQLLGDGWWEGKTPYTATFSIPGGLLHAGTNTLLLELPADTGDSIEGVWMDGFSITYGLGAVGGGTARFRGEDTPHAYAIGGFAGVTPAVYDVTDPAHPRVVTDWTLEDGLLTVADGGTTPAEYFIATTVQSPAGLIAAKDLSDPSGGGADYVIITHPQFADAIRPLADHRAAAGHQVATVDVEAIYDHFGDGRMSPEAIHDFLKYAYANWTPRPLYVLLVGDGTYDPRPYLPTSHLTYLPPYLAEVDPWMGETASDNRYADLTGDLLPELRVGRLPVNSPREVATVVDKILTYETSPASGDWPLRLIFSADNPSDAGDHIADAEAQFTVYAAPTSTYGYEGIRVYLSERGGADYLYTSASAANAALIAALNRGALLYTYFGHSSWLQEAVLETDGYAPLFHLNDIPRLTNAGRLPVILEMTCFTAYYIHPTEDTLDESLLRAVGGGVVAAWGSAGNGVTTDHRLLHRAFFASLFGSPVQGDEEPELGANIQAALLELYANGASHELIGTYHLFGDPAMQLHLTPISGVRLYLPLVMRSAP